MLQRENKKKPNRSKTKGRKREKQKKNKNRSKKMSMEERLLELQREFKTGEAQLEELDRQRARLRDTLLRISGAIQVLEELLNQEQETHESLFSCSCSCS